MKPELLDKILYNGRLADELKRSEGYQLIHKKLVAKREQVLKEALDSKTIDELRYNRGFLLGLDFFESTVEQLIQRANTQGKRN
jgi:hypothetical protein